MVRQIEREPYSPQVHSEQNTSKLPHGVAPETYGLLLFARDHNDILEKVDSLDQGKNRIISSVRNLLFLYFFNDISGRDLRKFVGGGERKSNARRMLEALEVIWQETPPEIQLQYPKEKAVRLKENPSNSPRILEKRKKTLVTLWEGEDYRKKRLEELRNRKNDPGFIAKMRETGKRRGSPMEGKKHSDATIAKIRKATQEIWNKRHDIEAEDTNEPLEKRNLLFTEWLRITQSLQRYPTYSDITKLRKERKVRFSTTMYKQVFGDGSFTRAKQLLDSMARTTDFLNDLQENPYSAVGRRVLESDIKKNASEVAVDIQNILAASSIDELRKGSIELDERLDAVKNQLKTRSAHIIETQIGQEERSTWEYIKARNLFSAVVQTGEITKQELDMLIDYFEKNIIREDLKVETFNKFTIAAAKVA